jgi:hypothetical protein
VSAATDQAMATEAWEGLSAGFARAGSGAGDIIRTAFVIAGQPVRLRVAGSALARQVLRAFGHLERAPEEEAFGLTIDLWDEDETGIACPDVTMRDSPVRIVAAPNGLVCDRIRDGLTVLDREQRRIIGWRRTAGSIQAAEQSRPLDPLLGCWAVDSRMTAVHGALVARRGAAALLAGKAGAGKSTTALACAVAGYDYLADDRFILARDASGSFVGHSLFATAQVSPSTLERFPQLPRGAATIAEPSEKVLVALADNIDMTCVSEARIQAILVPRVKSGPPAIRPATRSLALLALAPSSLLQHVGGGGAAGFERLAELTGAVPAWELDLGPDLSAIPALVDRILAG